MRKKRKNRLLQYLNFLSFNRMKLKEDILILKEKHLVFLAKGTMN